MIRGQGGDAPDRKVTAMTPRATNAALTKIANGHARVASFAHPLCTCGWWTNALTPAITQAYPTDQAARDLVASPSPKITPCLMHVGLGRTYPMGVVAKIKDAPDLIDLWAADLLATDLVAA